MSRRFEFHADAPVADYRLVTDMVGRVAEGVVFADGAAVVHWLEDPPSTTVWLSFEDAVSAPCRSGVRLVWVDGEAR